MTYRKDGSPFKIARGRVRPDILYYGWLSRLGPPYEKAAEKQDYEPFRNLADSVRHQMTRGHHDCEFCDWSSANYGNGEMWLRIGKTTTVFPRMLWHYLELHDYGLPTEIYGSIISGEYEIWTDQDFKELYVDKMELVENAPFLVCRAVWKEKRYGSMGEFFNKNNLEWNFSQASLQDGFYIVEIDMLPSDIDILFESDPENFPDKVIIIKENAGRNEND